MSGKTHIRPITHLIIRRQSERPMQRWIKGFIKILNAAGANFFQPFDVLRLRRHVHVIEWNALKIMSRLVAGHLMIVFTEMNHPGIPLSPQERGVWRPTRGVRDRSTPDRA